MARRVETGEANDAAWREMRLRLRTQTPEPRGPTRCERCGEPAKSLCAYCGHRRSKT